MDDNYLLNIKKKILFVSLMIDKYAGGNISFEGDLSKLNRNKYSELNEIPNDILKKNTIYPKEEFIIIPLNIENIISLKKDINNIGLHNCVTHIQIEYKGNFVLGLFDNFHKDCCVIDFSVGIENLEKMKTEGIINSYERKKT